jgi:hypothetical protein
VGRNKPIRVVWHALKTFGQVLAELLWHGRFWASPKWARERQQLCHVCPKYLKKQDLCTECYCIVGVKTRLEAAKCPDEWW